MRKERIALEHHGDRALRRRQYGHVAAGDRDAARVRLLEPGDEPQRRRLAAARRAEEHVERSGVERERDVVDRTHDTIGGRPVLAHVLGTDRGHRLSRRVQ
jgi:hypothetical protein